MTLLLDMTKADMPSGRYGTPSLSAQWSEPPQVAHTLKLHANYVDEQSAAIRFMNKKDIVLIQPPLAMSLEWTIALRMRLIKQKSGYATPVHGYTDQAIQDVPRGSDI